MKRVYILLLLLCVTVSCGKVEPITYPVQGEELGIWSGKNSVTETICDIRLEKATSGDNYATIYIPNPSTPVVDIYRGPYNYNNDTGIISVAIDSSNIDDSPSSAIIEYSIFGNRLWLKSISGSIAYPEYMTSKATSLGSVAGQWVATAANGNVDLNLMPYKDEESNSSVIITIGGANPSSNSGLWSYYSASCKGIISLSGEGDNIEFTYNDSDRAITATILGTEYTFYRKSF